MGRMRAWNILGPLLASGVVFGCQALIETAETSRLMDQIEDDSITNALSAATTEDQARELIAASPRVQALLAKGPRIAEKLMERFTDEDIQNRDEALAHYAYIFERLGFVPALPVLNYFLARAYDQGDLKWAIIFSERARRSLEALSA